LSGRVGFVHGRTAVSDTGVEKRLAITASKAGV